jgi:hypothetical protein
VCESERRLPTRSNMTHQDAALQTVLLLVGVFHFSTIVSDSLQNCNWCDTARINIHLYIAFISCHLKAYSSTFPLPEYIAMLYGYLIKSRVACRCLSQTVSFHRTYVHSICLHLEVSCWKSLLCGKIKCTVNMGLGLKLWHLKQHIT